MIFCKDILFIHVPKTGGMSLTKYLLEVLPRPVYYAHPEGDKRTADNSIVQIPGLRHETLEEAEKAVREYGFELSKFPLILAVLRNPYSLEVSRYAYLQKGHPVDKGHNQQLALTRSFESFAIESFDHGGPSRRLKRYFFLKGKMPKNLKIIKFENLAEDVREALRGVGIEKTADLPWVNRSVHDHFLSYYTKGAEEAVYRRYKWVFDNGFYERIKPEDFMVAEETPWRDHRVPIVGTARQVGPSHGLWPDLWVGDRLAFEVKTERLITKVTVEGALPHKFDTETEFVLTVNGQQSKASFESGGPFVLDAPCSIAPDTLAGIELTTSTTWSPKKGGASEDERQLSFALSRIVFEHDRQSRKLQARQPSYDVKTDPRLRDNAEENVHEVEVASVERTKLVRPTEPEGQKDLDTFDKTPRKNSTNIPWETASTAPFKYGTKRVLVCSPVMPAYDRESGSRRIFDLVEFFREAGWAVSFAAKSANNDEQRYAKILQQRGVATYLDFDRIEQVVTAGSFDLAILPFWNIAEQLIPTIRELSPTTRVIVDSIDLHFLRNARGIFLEPSRALDPEYASKMAREVNAYAASDAVMTVSQKEADLINDLTGDPTLAHMVPLGEDLPTSALPFAERKGILFIGNFRHPPNVEAARYLCEEILPELDPAILAEHPIYIVGNALNETVRGYGAGLAHVQMVGWVPSLLPYLQRARISIVPLLHGAGTKGKLIQALMVGTPSVSTSIGIEGLDLRNGEHVLVADDPATFADSIVRLLEDAELWGRLVRQGQAHIMTEHGREAVRTRLFQTVSTVLTKEVKSGAFAGDNSKLRWMGVDSRNGEFTTLIQKLRENNRTINTRNKDLNTRVVHLERRLHRINAHNENLNAHNENLKAHNEQLKAHANNLGHRLLSIENSRTWRLLGLYRRLRIKLASAGKSG